MHQFNGAFVLSQLLSMASIKELQAKLDDLQARHDEMAKHNSCVTGLLKNVKAIEKQREDAPFEVTGLITMQDEIRVNGKDQEIDLPPTSIIASGMAAGQLVELSKLGWARIKCRGFDIADGESFVNKRGYLQSKYKQVRVMHVTVISTSEDSAEAATEQQGELIAQEA